MSETLFTVVTITYNSAAWVAKAVETVLVSKFHNFEYIVCDDCSKDNTWEVIESYDDPRIRRFRHEKNIGEYPNRNFALQNATGKYLLFVDGDDELYPDTLGRLAEYASKFPEAGSMWGAPQPEFNHARLPLLLQPGEIIRWIYLANIRIAQFGFAETLFKTSLLKSIGGFSTNFISGDTHMKKMIALEAPVLVIPNGLVFWRISEGQASGRLSKNYNGFRNNVRIDQEILEKIKKMKLDLPLSTIEKNLRIRNIKLLFNHTFRKGRIADGFHLFKELHFHLKDVMFLFKKGDYHYRQKIVL